MGKQCYLCGNETIFFRWSSTRDFPREKMIEKAGRVVEHEKKGLLTGREGVPVCVRCCRKLKR